MYPNQFSGIARPRTTSEGGCEGKESDDPFYVGKAHLNDTVRETGRLEFPKFNTHKSEYFFYIR